MALKGEMGEGAVRNPLQSWLTCHWSARFVSSQSTAGYGYLGQSLGFQSQGLRHQTLAWSWASQRQVCLFRMPECFAIQKHLGCQMWKSGHQIRKMMTMLQSWPANVGRVWVQILDRLSKK